MKQHRVTLLPAACIPLQVEARQLDKRERIKKRHQVIRKKVSGHGSIGNLFNQGCLCAAGMLRPMLLQVEGKPERPRLAVYRSNNNIYVQVR